MKNLIRVFLLCLALLMCLTPVLVACDKGAAAGDTETTVGEETDGGDDVAYATGGKYITNAPQPHGTAKVVFYLLEDTAGKDTVKCSLVMYNTEDNSVLDYKIFDLKVNGKDPNIKVVKTTMWYDTYADVTVRDADDNTTVYTLKIKK